MPRLKKPRVIGHRAKLNIAEQPGVGMGYIIRDLKTKKYLRASTTCQRDIKMKNSQVKTLRSFSGDNPFFTAKIGSRNTEVQYLTFLCGEQHPKCLDETGQFEWLGMSLSDARAQNLDFDESGYYVSGERKEQPVRAAKPKKTKAAKKVKAKKTKVAKKVKVAKATKTTGAKRGRKPRMIAAPTTPAQVMVNPTVAEIKTTAPEVEEPVTPKKPEQSDDEFMAELDADFHAKVEELKQAGANA